MLFRSGHGPFGHAGELELDARMAEHGGGGFNHNEHSLRVVELLEHPYPAFRGLNLTLAVRAGLARHSGAHDRPGSHRLADGLAGTLEGQAASLADRIAYNGHDIEDGLAAGLIVESDLMGVGLWAEASAGVRGRWGESSVLAVRRPILDRMLARVLEDVSMTTLGALASAGIRTSSDAVAHGRPLVGMSASMASAVGALEGLLWSRVYGHASVAAMDARGRRMVGALFEAYVRRPELMPSRFASRVADQGVARVVCDYVAGMTDRYCEGAYEGMGGG